jgi:hypothetical protein
VWRGEHTSFLRRSWRYHPRLAAVWAAIFLAAAAVSIVRLVDDDAAWPDLVWLVLLVANFVCFVMLIRRDDPDPES